MPDTEKEKHGSLVDKYVAIDIEYAGQEPGRDGIVMLAAVKVIGGRSIGKFKSLIAPQPETAGKAAKKTGIDAATLLAAPKLETMLPAFLSFIGSDPIVGHDVCFVGNFLDGLYRGLLGDDTGTRIIDTKTLAAELYPELANCDLATLSERLFGSGTTSKHDSKAELTARCYEYMKRYCLKNGKEPSDSKQAQQPSTAPSSGSDQETASKPAPVTVQQSEPIRSEKQAPEAPKKEPKVSKQVDLENTFAQALPDELPEEGGNSGKVWQVLLKVALALLAVAICFWLIMYVFKQKPFWLLGALAMIPFYLGVIIALGKKKTK